MAYYIWKLYEAVIYITTTQKITVKPELILMLKLPPKLDTLPRATRNYAHIMAIIYRRAIYNIYYDNILEINKKEIISMMQKSMQLIKSYTLNCFRFMKVNGDRALAAWMQFGMQETRRIIDKFPSVSTYIRKMTDPDQPDNTENDIEDSILQYRI